jgi:hypothetical protein
MVSPLTLTEEQIISNQLKAERDRVNKFIPMATPQLATRIGQIYRDMPQLPAGVVLSAAQSNLPDEQLKIVGDQTATTLTNDPNAMQPEKKKSWFERNIMDKVKTTAQYGFAALDLPMQLGVNAASQIFNAGNNEVGTKGWFASTDLGSLLKNPDQAGSGFFVGGETKQLQSQRVQAFRGAVPGGHAWDIGRGMAGVVFDEGSMPYNLMSGMIDGALALAMPVLPGEKLLAGAVKGAAEAGKGGDIIRGIDVAFDLIHGKGTAIKLSEMSGTELDVARKAAGLIGKTVDAAEAHKFMGTEKGLRLIDRLVDADTTDAIRKLTNTDMYPETVKRLRDATTHAEVESVLADILGVAQQGLVRTVMPGTRRFGLSNARRLAVVDNLVGTFEDTRLGRIAERAFENRPMRNIIDFSADNPKDVRIALNDMDRWMKVSLSDNEARVKMLDKAMDAMVGASATPTARKQLSEDFRGLILQSWKEAGVSDEISLAILDGHKSFLDASVAYHASIDGAASDAGMLAYINGVTTKVSDAVLAGPLTTSEMARYSIELPDVAQVRAVTGRYNKIWRKDAKNLAFIDENVDRLAQAGKLKLPFAAAQYFQEQIFRKLITATGGFSVRNIAEGQASLAMSQRPVTSIFRHPIEHMQWSVHDYALGKMIGRKGIGDIMGEEFVAGVGVPGMEEYSHALGVGITSQVSDQTDLRRIARRTGYHDEVTRGSARQRHVIEAHSDHLSFLADDVVMKQIAGGATDQELVDFIKTNKKGQKWFRDQQDYHINGRPTYTASGPANGKWGKQVVDLNDQQNLDYLLQNYRERFDVIVGAHPELRAVVNERLLPPVTVNPRQLGWDASFRGQTLDVEIGNKLTRVTVDAADESIVRPLAFVDGDPTGGLADLLKKPQIYNDPKLAQVMSHEVRTVDKAKEFRMKDAYDRTFDRFHGFMSQKPTAYLERSPAFKQRYYSWAIDEMITSLSPADLDKMVTRITTKASQAGITPSQYVGDHAVLSDMVTRLFNPSKQAAGDRWQRILDLQANPNKLKGTLSLSDVDEFAKGQALDDLAKMTYDASERKNITDVMRMITPFGQAQTEFFRRLSRIYTVETGMLPLPNLSALRKTQLIIEGGKEADPDGDGRGFAYKDPTTGEWSFDYPFTKSLNHLATSVMGGGPGVKATFQAPIKGAIMGFDVRPGVGPVVQLAMSAFAPDIPQLDFVKSVVMPYGETDIQGKGGLIGALVASATPAYLTKLLSLFDSPESATAYGNTYMEVYQALAASTEYDLTTEQGKDEIYKDATWRARYLTVMRALGQFMGPSRPTPKMSINVSSDAAAKLRAEGRPETDPALLDVLDGDVFTNVLSMELRTMQLEDYDTAIPRFLDIYGDQVFVYLSGKTKAAYGGLQASKEFGNFERSNKDLFRKYKDVAGYFVEGGTDLDWQVYQRQLQNKERIRLTPKETLDAAQKYVAFSKYRQVQDLVGAYPNAEQRKYLSDYREVLGQQYPGFASSQYDPNKFQTDVTQLQEAVNDKNLTNNQVATAAKLYLQTRDAVLAEAANRGLKTIDRSKNTEDLRGYMRQYAATLKEQYPDFARLYDRLLSQEVDE